MACILEFRQHAISSLLEIRFSDSFVALISYELLRVYSPSSPQISHFSSVAPLVTNKVFVRLVEIVPQSTVGLILHFDDGHQSNLFSNGYLYQLCVEQDRLWHTYMNRLRIAQQARSNCISCLQVG